MLNWIIWPSKFLKHLLQPFGQVWLSLIKTMVDFVNWRAKISAVSHIPTLRKFNKVELELWNLLQAQEHCISQTHVMWFFVHQQENYTVMYIIEVLTVSDNFIPWWLIHQAVQKQQLAFIDTQLNYSWTLLFSWTISKVLKLLH